MDILSWGLRLNERSKSIELPMRVQDPYRPHLYNLHTFIRLWTDTVMQISIVCTTEITFGSSLHQCSTRLRIPGLRKSFQTLSLSNVLRRPKLAIRI